MKLFDFDLNDTTPEQKTLHDVSVDNGKTWTKKWLTPTEVLQYRMDGYVTRPGSSGHKIALYPGTSATPVIMIISVPSDRDKEEYIDEYLDGLLSDFVRYDCKWEFV